MIDEFISQVQQPKGYINYMCPSVEKIIRFFRQLKQESGNEVDDLFIPFSFKAGDVLLSAGKVSDRLWIMKRGIIRVDQALKGVDYLTRFYFPYEFVCEYFSKVNKSPSAVTISAAFDCEGWYADWNQLEALKNRYAIMNQLEYLIAACDSARKDERWLHYLDMDAKGQYLYLLEHYPILIENLQLSVIAQSMGITQQSLSRLRNQVSKRPKMACKGARTNYSVRKV